MVTLVMNNTCSYNFKMLLNFFNVFSIKDTHRLSGTFYIIVYTQFKLKTNVYHFNNVEIMQN